MRYGINVKAVAILTICLLASAFPPAVRARDLFLQDQAGYHHTSNHGLPEPAKPSSGAAAASSVGARSRVVVRGEGSPLLYIGGTIGIHGEVFFGDIPAAPDEAGTDGEGSSDTDSPADATGADDSGDQNDYLPPKPSGATLPGIRQNLDLFFDARFGDAIQAFTRLSTQGVWGVGRPSDASPWMPSVSRPLFVDEAWARYSGKGFRVSAGKQRFSLGPIGLLGRTDLEAAEGVRADIDLGGWYLTGVWSRLSSGYYYNSSFVTRADDLFGVRVARPWTNATVACNYLASGLGDETGYSLELTGRALGHSFAAELGFFRSSTTLYPEYRTAGWVPAFVARAEAVNTPVHRLEASYGRISRGFTPYYSSVASRSGGQALPFDENTEGMALSYDRRVSSSTELNVRSTWLRFLDEAASRGEGESSPMAQADITPVLSASVRVTRELGPNTSVQAGYEHWWMRGDTSYGRLTTGMTVNF